MATMPTRAATFAKAFGSIIGQVDRLYLYLDGMDELPEVVRGDARVVPIFSHEEPGLGCDGKFLALVREAGSFLFAGIDDDIVYPPDYASRLAAALDTAGEPCIVGVHGARLKQPHGSYHDDRTVFHMARRCDRREPVDILGTGTLMFDAAHLSFDPRKWSVANVTDLHVAIEAAKRGLPLYCIEREDGFLHVLEEVQHDSLYLAMSRDDGTHTRLARELLAMREAVLE